MPGIEKILDSLSELVYVADAQTYELLYLNPPGKAHFQVSEMAGKHCYEVLQHRESPCPFCNNDKMELNQVYTWEFTNPVVGRHFLLKDQLVDWDGRLARLEIAFDTTAHRQERVELETRMNVEHLIVECSQKLFQGDVLRETAREVLCSIGSYMKADRAYLVTLHGGRAKWMEQWVRDGQTSMDSNLGMIEQELERFQRSRESSKEVLVVEDIEILREKHPQLYQRLRQADVTSVMATPLERDGVLLGFLVLYNPSMAQFHCLRDIFHTLRYFISLSICREEDTERLRFLSYRDPLTELYNRNRFTLDTQALAGQNAAAGILYMNINGLAETNEMQGHAFGDQVIINYAQRIRAVFPAEDVYRIGGDEFAVLLRTEDELDFRRQAIGVQKLLEQVGPRTIAVGYHWTATSAKIYDTISAASAMMYEEKRKHYLNQPDAGRYRQKNDPAIAMNTAEKLQKLIGNGRLLVYLQPKFSFADGTLTGAEAVVRFCAEGGEIVSPVRFLPDLEELRLISFVDFYVLEQVCASLKAWEQRGMEPVPVAVNFSRYSLTEINFISRLNDICRSCGVSRGLLEIEITESVESEAGFNLKLFNEQLQAAGYKVVIDDFGARYANLALLTSAPFDRLKIDKSLIDTVDINEKARQVVQSLAFLCNSLHIGTTVEGVETQSQFQALQNMGFEEVQGFLFSRPIPVTEFEETYLRPLLWQNS